VVVFDGFSSAEIIPPERRVIWQGNVGVSGDIPRRTTICKMISPSGGDDTAALQAAIDACPAGQIVKLSPGTFKVSSSFRMGKYGYGITLRGAGMGATTIRGTANFKSAGFVLSIHPYNEYSSGVGQGSYSWDLSYPSPKDLTRSGLAKGSTTIATSSPHGWTSADVARGLYIQVDQLYNAYADPPISPIGNSACGGGHVAQVVGEGVIVQMRAVVGHWANW